MRSHAPARRPGPSLARSRYVHEDEETAEAVQPNEALLRMARRGAYDDEPTVTAFVDASDDGVLVPCVHAAPAPGTMPVIPRQLVEDIEQYARASIARHYAWSVGTHPGTALPAPPAAYASGAYPSVTEGSGIYGPYGSGVYGAYGTPRIATTETTRPSARPRRRTGGSGDFLRNLAAVCFGLVGALAVGTGAVVWYGRSAAPAPGETATVINAAARPPAAVTRPVAPTVAAPVYATPIVTAPTYAAPPATAPAFAAPTYAAPPTSPAYAPAQGMPAAMPPAPAAPAVAPRPL